MFLTELLIWSYGIHRKFLRGENVKDYLKQVDQFMQHCGVTAWQALGNSE